MSVLAPPIEGAVDPGPLPISYNWISTATTFPADATVDYRVEFDRPPAFTNPSQIIALSRETCYFHIIAGFLYSYMFFSTGGALAVTVNLSTIPGFPAVGSKVQVRAEFNKDTDTHSLWWRLPGTDLKNDVGWNLVASTVRTGNGVALSNSWLLVGANANNTLMAKAYRWYRRVNGVDNFDFAPDRDMAIGTKITGNTGTAATPLVGSAVTFQRWPNITSITLPGTAAQSMSTADTSVLDILGDITFVAKVSLADWSDSLVYRTLLSKRDSATTHAYRWFVYDGRLYMSWSPDGTDGANKVSMSAPLVGNVPGLVDGQHLWIATTLDVNNGAGGYTARHWYSLDAIDYGEPAWTKLGTDDVVAGVTSIANTLSALNIGAGLGGSFPLAGNIRYLSVRTGIGALGVPSQSEAFTISKRTSKINATQLVDDTGKIVTVNATPTFNIDPAPKLLEVYGPKPRAYLGTLPIKATYLGDTPVTTVYSNAA